jgi:hypothetical protein
VYFILTTLLLSIMVPSGNANKCANKYIYISGKIVGPTNSQLKIEVQTTPDANWEPQPAIALRQGAFDGKVYFDSTKTEGTTNDDCSRAPEKVRVALLNEGRQIDLVQLDISKDFIKNKMGDYELRSSVELHSQ